MICSFTDIWKWSAALLTFENDLQLRYAIAHCKAIDTDFTARGPLADDSEGEDDAYAGGVEVNGGEGGGGGAHEQDGGVDDLSYLDADTNSHIHAPPNQSPDGPCRIS